MRTVVIQVSGLADAPAAALGGKTPLEVATTPMLDELASRGILGLMRSIAEGAAPTITAATAQILGIDPAAEIPAPGAAAAVGVGAALGEGHRAAMLDLVAVAEREGGGTAVAETRFPKLTADDGLAIAQSLAEALAPVGARVIGGLAGSHVVVFAPGAEVVFACAPDEALGRPLAELLPATETGGGLRAFLSRARAALWEHPVCLRLRAVGEVAPTDVWPWGSGAAVAIPAFSDHFGVRGAAVAVAPEVRGVALSSGLAVDAASVLPPADRVARTLALGAAHEFVLLHVETIDQAGARGDAVAKADAITRLDADVFTPLVAGLREAGGDWRLAVVSDVTSASDARRFTADPVPFVVATPRDAGRASAPRRRFTERDAREQGIFLGEAYTLLDRLLRR